MVSLRRVGVVLLVLGLLLTLHSFAFSASTQRACPGIESVVYDAVGVHPAGVEVTAVDLSASALIWSDGCNWRSSNLASLFPGLLSLGGGVAVAALGVVRGRVTN